MTDGNGEPVAYVYEERTRPEQALGAHDPEWKIRLSFDEPEEGTYHEIRNKQELVTKHD